MTIKADFIESGTFASIASLDVVEAVSVESYDAATDVGAIEMPSKARQVTHKERNGTAPRANSVKIKFDAANPRSFFKDSGVEELRSRELTERELVEEVLALKPDLTLERFVHDAVQLLAKRIIATQLSGKAKQAQRGIEGQADDRIEIEYKRLEADNKRAQKRGKPATPITAYYLAKAAKTGSRTVEGWAARKGIALD